MSNAKFYCGYCNEELPDNYLNLTECPECGYGEDPDDDFQEDVVEGEECIVCGEYSLDGEEMSDGFVCSDCDDNYITKSDFEERYCEMLDDCYDDVVIGSLIYSPSDILLKVDPIAYNCGMSDYASSLYEDGYYVEGHM